MGGGCHHRKGGLCQCQVEAQIGAGRRHLVHLGGNHVCARPHRHRQGGGDPVGLGGSHPLAGERLVTDRPTGHPVAPHLDTVEVDDDPVVVDGRQQQPFGGVGGRELVAEVGGHPVLGDDGRLVSVAVAELGRPGLPGAVVKTGAGPSGARVGARVVVGPGRSGFDEGDGRWGSATRGGNHLELGTVDQRVAAGDLDLVVGCSGLPQSDADQGVGTGGLRVHPAGHVDLDPHVVGGPVHHHRADRRTHQTTARQPGDSRL